MSKEEVLFREEQTFRQPWMLYIAVPIILFFLLSTGTAIYRQIYLGRPVGDEPMSDSWLIGFSFSIALLLIAIIYLFFKMKLTVTITQTVLHIRFYPIVNRIIRLSEIEKCAAVTYQPLREYGGWGIRLSIRGRGVAYTVSGKRGVFIVLKNGRKLLLGSKRAEELEAILLKQV